MLNKSNFEDLMLRIFLMSSALLIFASNLQADNTGQLNLDFSKAWFKPKLILNKNEICDLVVNDARDFFFTDNRWSGYREPARDGYVKSLTEVAVEDGKGMILIKGTPLYFYQHTEWANCCMGTQGLLFSDKAFTDDYEWKYGSGNFSPIENGFFRIYTDNEDSYIVATDLDGTISDVFLINSDHSTTLVCGLKLEPDQSEIDSAVILADAKQEIDDLKSSLALVRGGSGNCGSANSHGWGTHWTNQRLKSSLFRPWIIDSGYASEASADKTSESISVWGLLGISNHEAAKKLKIQMDQTVYSLKNLYKSEYKIMDEEAMKMAENVVENIVAQSMSFSWNFDSVISSEEKNLREMILNNARLSEIEKYANSINLNFDESIKFKRNESILNVSMHRPDVIKFLLKKQVSVDSVNGFGKTPLMYAAQQNQLDSAKILIDHEANTVAATTRPDNTCYYTLKTYGMTPLHYAVRYASPEFIKLLLDNGAAPFMKAENHHKYPMAEETPLDWLHRYTAINSPEKNPNIPDDKVAEIEKWLRPLSDEELSMKAQEYIVAGEGAYQQGKMQEAYRALIKALEIKPDDERALSDMSLIALKNGDLGISLTASDKLIKNSADNKIKANAWFNHGLACEKHKSSGENGWLSYNGKHYCQESILYPYLQAHISETTSSRTNKLLEIFNKNIVPSCELAPNEQGLYKLHFAKINEEQKIYVFHLKNISIDPAQIHWGFTMWYGKSNTSQFFKFSPTLVASHDLGDYVIDELESQNEALYPVVVGGLSCEAENSKDRKK